MPQSNNGSGVGVNGKPKSSSRQVSIQAVVDHPLFFLLWKFFMYSFAIFNWCMFLFLAVKSGSFFEKPTEQEENQFEIARDKFWNLSKQPIPGFNHRFLKTRSGFQFHYLCNRLEADHVGDLVFLVHGFPNSSMVWRFMLKEPTLPVEDATFIAVDMPGFGGSDSLKKYDTQVLELLTEFVVTVRENYELDGDNTGSTLIVGHDWGCVVIMRLAAEAPCLADRWIMTNGPLVALTKANVERALNSSQMIFRQFQASPLKNFACLRKSIQAIKPVLWQAFISGYIFVFQLPSPFVRYLGEGGNASFLRAACRNEHGKSSDDAQVYETFAGNLGPGAAECKSTTADGASGSYGASVAHRNTSIGEVFWQTTAYYRDGLATSAWEKTLETVAALHNINSAMSTSSSPARRRSSASVSSSFGGDPLAKEGSLRAPATVVWGEDDLALTRAVCLDGIADYLARNSEVILLPRAGHWTPVEPRARGVLARIVRIFAAPRRVDGGGGGGGDSADPPVYIAEQVRKFDPGATLVAKK